MQMKLKKMANDIENENFSWDNYEDDLISLNEFLSMFLTIKEEPSRLYYIKISQIHPLYPLNDLINFF